MRRNQWLTILLAAAVLLAGAACDSSNPAQPSQPSCTLTLSMPSLGFGSGGGTQTVNVSTGSQCSWSASSDRGWMTLSPASGSGNGSVSVTVAANSGPAERTGTATVGGQTVAVRQDGVAPCTFELAPAAASFDKDPATGSFTVNTASQCDWTAASDAGWLVVTGGRSGSGPGTVSYSVERNRDLTARSASIRVGDKTFTATQGADTAPLSCEYSIAPVEFSPCMSSGTALTATLTTAPGCTWTVEADASWITVGSASGSGPGPISFRVSDNWDAPRQGLVRVRWPTVTAGQNLRIQQAGCLYAVTTTAIGVGATGGQSSFDVFQQAMPNTCGGATQDACLWTATADVAWIAVVSPMPQRGDNRVSFNVAANQTGVARTGRITVKDKVVVITQAQ